MNDATDDADLTQILRARPMRLPQRFPEHGAMSLLAPLDTTTATYANHQIAFGPFSASVVMGAIMVGIESRLNALQDLWRVIYNEAFPAEEQREPGGEPVASVRTATLGWQLLAALGSAVEGLVATADCVYRWRQGGQPLGAQCRIGNDLLSYRTDGAASVSRDLLRFSNAAAVDLLMGYPTEEVLRRYVSDEEAAVLVLRNTRSSMLLADVFRVASGLVQDPFWRTFIRWKHGFAVTSPGAAPLWLPDDADVEQDEVEAKLRTGIVVFDLQDGPALYIWPAERTDLALYSVLATQAIHISQKLLESVVAYVDPVYPALNWYDIDEAEVLSAAELAALERLGVSGYRTAALAGIWGPERPPSR